MNRLINTLEARKIQIKAAGFDPSEKSGVAFRPIGLIHQYSPKNLATSTTQSDLSIPGILDSMTTLADAMRVETKYNPLNAMDWSGFINFVGGYWCMNTNNILIKYLDMQTKGFPSDSIDFRPSGGSKESIVNGMVGQISGLDQRSRERLKKSMLKLVSIGLSYANDRQSSFLFVQNILSTYKDGGNIGVKFGLYGCQFKIRMSGSGAQILPQPSYTLKSFITALPYNGYSKLIKDKEFHNLKLTTTENWLNNMRTPSKN